MHEACPETDLDVTLPSESSQCVSKSQRESKDQGCLLHQKQEDKDFVKRVKG